MRLLAAAALAVLVALAAPAADRPNPDVYIPMPAPPKADPAPPGPGPLVVTMKVGTYLPVYTPGTDKVRIKLSKPGVFLDQLKVTKDQLAFGTLYTGTTPTNAKFADNGVVLTAAAAGVTDVVVDANGPNGPVTLLELRVTVVGCNDQPPPDDGKKNDDKKAPPVITGVPYGLFLVEETKDAAQSRGKFFADPDLRAFMNAKGIVWTAVDKDVVGPDGTPPASLVPYLRRAAGKPLPYFVVVDKNGRVLAEGVADFTQVQLKKYLGG